MKRRWARAVILWFGPLVLALAIGIWHPGRTTDFGQAIEGQLLDLRFAVRGPIEPPRDIAIVLIDEVDLGQMGGFPPPRDALADAIDQIAARDPVAVAIDLLLIDTEGGDDALAQALGNAPGAVVAFARADPEAVISPSLAEAARRSTFDIVIDAPTGFVGGARGPNDTLAPVVALGHANIVPDGDGAVRRIPASVALFAGAEVIYVPGLALAALRAAHGEARLVLRGGTERRDGSVGFGGGIVPLDHSGAIPLVPYGPGGTIQTYPLRDIVSADLMGKTVFLGMTGLGVGDVHATAFDAVLPGVELQATLAANILEGRHLRRDRTAWLADLAIGLLAALGATAASMLGQPVRTSLAIALGAVVLGAIAQTALLLGWWLDAVTLSLIYAGATTLGVLHRFARQHRRAANLARYMSPLLSETLSNDVRPAFEGQSRQAAVIFVDIEGSTGISEALGIKENERFLSRFHNAVERAADASGGVVEQFAGDGAMIIFGLLEARPSDADQALHCIAALFAEMSASGSDIPIRVGAHMGRARASVLGGAQQRHVTITGDVVNVASRLQEVAKATETRIAISDTLLQATEAPRDWVARLDLNELGLQALRGRKAQLHVWAGAGPAPDRGEAPE